jgi:hypothetical protein
MVTNRNVARWLYYSEFQSTRYSEESSIIACRRQMTSSLSLFDKFPTHQKVLRGIRERLFFGHMVVSLLNLNSKNQHTSLAFLEAKLASNVSEWELLNIERGLTLPRGITIHKTGI